MRRCWILMLVLAPGLAQSPDASFEVASVKPNTTGGRDYRLLPGGRLVGKNLSLKGWIQIAYGLKDFQVSGPDWISRENFDIEARAGNRSATNTQLVLMLQSLLAERFQLKLHRATKEMPVYTLVIAPGGLKMKASKDQTLWAGDYPDGAPDGQPTSGASPSILEPGRLAGEAIPINEFTMLLSGPLGRVVVNRTGLTGRYDMDLRYVPAVLQDQDRDGSAPSLFTAVQEQLGLKLEANKAPVEILIIDRIERPTAN